MLEIVICDDNVKLLETYQSIIERIIRDNNMNAMIKFTSSSLEELDKFLKNEVANFFILDIDMKSSKTGLDIAQKIRENFKNSYILFVSAHLEYVFLSFKVRPFNFLPKPINFEILQANILDVYKDYAESQSTQVSKVISIKTGGIIHKLKIADIISIEKSGSKTIIYLKYSQIFCDFSLNSLYDTISDNRFVRCHKSFICNNDYVKEYRLSENMIVMDNDMTFAIGRKYKKEIAECIR